jgi:hypothetical protein
VRRRARAADRQMPEPPGQRDRPDLPGEAAQRARTGPLVGAAIAHVAASATWSRSVAIRHLELTLLGDVRPMLRILPVNTYPFDLAELWSRTRQTAPHSLPSREARKSP